MAAPVPHPKWLETVCSRLTELLDSPLYTWAPMALQTEATHLHACLDAGYSPYASWPEAMACVYDAVVSSDVMQRLYEGALGGRTRSAGNRPVPPKLIGTLADESYREKLFKRAFDYEEFPLDNCAPRCVLCRVFPLSAETGWKLGLLGRDACQPCSARLKCGGSRSNAVDRFARPIILSSLN